MTEDPSFDLANPEGRSDFVVHALNNPETRAAALGLLKKINPQSVVPEIDVADRVRGELAEKLGEKDKAITDLQDTVTQLKLENERNKKWNELRHKGYTDDEILEAEKLLVDKKIASYDTALEYHRMKHQPPQTENPGDGVLSARLHEQPAFDTADMLKAGSRRQMREYAKSKARYEYSKILSELRR